MATVGCGFFHHIKKNRIAQLFFMGSRQLRHPGPLGFGSQDEMSLHTLFILQPTLGELLDIWHLFPSTPSRGLAPMSNLSPDEAFSVGLSSNFRYPAFTAPLSKYRHAEL